MTRARKTTRNKAGRNILVCLLIASTLPFFGYRKSDVEFRCFPVKDENCTVAQGEVLALLVRVKKPPKSLRGSVWKKAVPFQAADDDKKFWSAYIPAGRSQKPGRYLLHVFVKPNSGKSSEFLLPVIIEEKDYPVEKLTLDPEMVELSKEAAEQVKQDNRILVAAMSEVTPEIYWQGAFEPPVPGDVRSEFGTRRIINNIPKSPHSGTDLAAAEGDEIHATNNGRVSLVYLGYLTGNSVIIDHGGGIYSVYYHMSSVRVLEGAMVNKGDVIGLAGATGRVSGPHLHFGIRINRNNVNPMSFLEVSAQMEQALSDLSGD
jgi:murein DD-endopeptidase MepM/ murein hydrolase activator NlpD